MSGRLLVTLVQATGPIACACVSVEANTDSVWLNCAGGERSELWYVVIRLQEARR
jgi:hypothetical protein